jgi:protein-disulfide isomerase
MNRLFRSVFVFLTVIALASFGFAADLNTLLKPPPGTRVAVVVFEDLQCPHCAQAYPIVWEAAKAHNVPVLLHDFPLSKKFPWSFRAAVYARFFDTKSQKLGDDFRGYIYKNQPQITPENLDQYARKYADDNKIPLPFAIDPEGKLKEKIQADYELGERVGFIGTPAIYIVGNGEASQALVEQVKDETHLSQTLSQMIEDMQKKVGPATQKAGSAGTPSKRASSKGHKKPN